MPDNSAFPHPSEGYGSTPFQQKCKPFHPNLYTKDCQASASELFGAGATPDKTQYWGPFTPLFTGFDSADKYYLHLRGEFVGLSSTELRECPPYFIPQSLIPSKSPNPTGSLTIQCTGHPHHEAFCDSPARSPPSHLWSPVCSFPISRISFDCWL